MLRPIWKLRDSLLIGVFVTAIGTLLLSYPFGRALVSPIVRLRDAAVRLSSGDMTARAPLTSVWFPDEIEQLRLAFNSMADTISNSYNSMEAQVAERTTQLEVAKKMADAANAAKSACEYHRI